MSTGLTNLTKFIRAKRIRLVRNQGHVRGDGSEAKSSPEMTADHGSVFAELPKSARNRSGDHEQCSSGGGVGSGVVALVSDPVRQRVGSTRTARVLVPNVANTDTIGLI